MSALASRYQRWLYTEAQALTREVEAERQAEADRQLELSHDAYDDEDGAW